MITDRVGHKYGRLTVIDRAGSTQYGIATWRCICSCGNEHIANGNSLQQGCTKSCGCLHKEVTTTNSKRDDVRKKNSLANKGRVFPIESGNGAGENNRHAKYWWFIKDSVHYKFKSLNKFVRDNKHLFSGSELKEYKTEGRAAKVYQATTMLRHLHLLKKDGTPRIPSHEWHGWTIGEKWEQGYYKK